MHSAFALLTLSVLQGASKGAPPCAPDECLRRINAITSTSEATLTDSSLPGEYAGGDGLLSGRRLYVFADHTYIYSEWADIMPETVFDKGTWSVDRSERGSMPTSTNVRVTSFAPQFLVDDLTRSMAYYEKIGFRFGEPWDGFYAIGHLDGLEVHLKESPKNQAERRWRRDNEHLDAASGVDGIEAFYERCVANGVAILKPLTATAWGTREFYVEDPDGYVLSFGGRPATTEQ